MPVSKTAKERLYDGAEHFIGKRKASELKPWSAKEAQINEKDLMMAAPPKAGSGGNEVSAWQAKEKFYALLTGKGAMQSYE